MSLKITCSRCFGLAALLLTFTLAAVSTSQGQIFFGGWTVSEFQPDIANGGRANTIAVDPANNAIILVTSESGGLFRSTDSGVTWTHIGALPEYSMGAVVFHFADPNVAIATTNEDFRTANGGGIWRSTDAGLHWSQIPSPPAPAGVTARFGAGEISIAPDTGNVYIATVYGVGISADRGLTWNYVRPFTADSVFTVLAQSGNHVLAGGPSGIARSADGGATWTMASAGPGGIWDMHALGGSPFSSSQAYVVNGNTSLFFTEDAGDHWTQITAAPAGGGSCGGIAFVKAMPFVIRLPRPPFRRRFVQLYMGNRCGIARLSAPEIATSGRFDYSGTWTGLNVDHGDTRDLGFDNAHHPLLLGTDGGLHKTSDGGMNWTFTGGGHNGYNALQITEVRGQWINDVGRHDLYFGTQDNNLYSSGDGGVTWADGSCCEGFFIEAQHRVPSAADSQVTYVACGPCGNFRAGDLFGGVTGWGNPPGNVAGNPKIMHESFHVQGVDDSGGFSTGFASTANLGAAWQQYASFPEDRRDLPKLTASFFSSVLYQSVRTGYDFTRNFEIDHFARISKTIFFPNVSVTYPAMNNFGGLGINPTMFAWYQVFGVDPGNTGHIIAPDIVNEKMMETWDGGNNWTEIPQLTQLVTDHGNFLFRSSIFPHASAVAFSPDDPRMVAVGTFQGGIFLSSDRGASWSKVPGSEKVTYITSFDWRTPQNLIVSTYGRGLWKVDWRWWIPWREFEAYCNLACVIHAFPPLPDPPPDGFSNAVLVFDGGIQGARVANGRVQELFVRPGTVVSYFGKEKSVPEVKVTESVRQRGFIGAPWAKVIAGRKENLAGLALGKDGKVIGAVWSSAPLSLTQKEKPQEESAKGREAGQEQEKKQLGREQSPTQGKPYLRLRTGEAERTNLVAPGGRMQLFGREFPVGTVLEVAIDDRVVEKVTVGEDRAFKIAIPAPEQFGLHRLVVRDASGKPIDGFMFLVSHEDKPTNPPPKKRPVKQTTEKSLANPGGSR